MSTIIDNLVTDRTQADVERVKALAVKGYAGMTALEAEEAHNRKTHGMNSIPFG